jgi:hypothetical protein
LNKDFEYKSFGDSSPKVITATSVANFRNGMKRIDVTKDLRKFASRLEELESDAIPRLMLVARAWGGILAITITCTFYMYYELIVKPAHF